MEKRDLWRSALGEVELNISQANFITWFKNTAVQKVDNGVVTVVTPNGFNKEWLENKYNKLILKSLRNVSPEIKEVHFVIGQIKDADPGILKKLSGSPSPKKKETLTQQAGFREFEADKETNLNAKYVFDNFVVGSFNELAQAAAQAVIKSPGKLYNPLFIYGGVGLGKTHLLQATGNSVMREFEGFKVKYISSDKFTGELVNALHQGKMEEFKEKYRQIDMLIIDDIQFLAGREKTQTEFFHLFNTLYQNNKQIIISSDRPPKAIATLEERLRSRFEGGMIADISMPDLETRMAILKTKTEQQKINLDDESLNYIASHIQTNIRELEGALNRIVAHYKINDSLPSLAKIKKLMSGIVNAPKKTTSHKAILKSVAEFYDISISDLLNKCRRKEIVWPRQIAMYLMRCELRSSYPFIGEKLGGRDHTTVIYACEKIEASSKEDEKTQRELHLIKERLYNSD